MNLSGRSRGTWLGLLLIACTVGVAAEGCSTAPTGLDRNTWHLLPGHVERLSVSAFRNGRTCWVYLPPNYAHSSRRYPVLYVQDGELAFDGGMHINRICEAMIRRGEIQPIIVVAIENGPYPQRYIDYTPWPAGFMPGSEGGGDVYVRAITDTLKPIVDERYRTLPGPFDTGITGVSLGGLISVYAAYASDGTFGKVAAFSPSYWWSNFHQFVEARERPASLYRLYQDSGYPDDNWIGGIQEILLTKGFTLGADLMSYTVSGAQHDYPEWEHRIPTMLRFLFPADGS